MDEENDVFCISAAEAGVRLDKVLSTRFDSIKSRNYFQTLFAAGKILLNGLPAKKSMLSAHGDEVEIQWSYTPALQLTPENIPLQIIYEDEALLVINKAAGLVVHPAAGNWSGTLVNALLYHCQQWQTAFPENASSMRPGIVHRLDKDTTGLLLAAKTSDMQARLMALFSARQIEKEYLAICIGNPGTRTIDLPIARHPVRRKEMTICHERGKNGVTLCRTLAHNEKLAFVCLQLLTGRTHQLRVHLKAVGFPILGDPLYGSQQMNRKFGLQRQMLHAHRLRFCHPLTGKMMEFTAPLPQDMEQQKIFL